MELGEKLRQTRLELGLSQRQVCGDTITRNMLSRIENGQAKPSMKTLQYLASVLQKPVGYFLGGLLVDQVFEPLMAGKAGDSWLVRCFGMGKGSGAACLFAVLWLAGIGVCLLFRFDKAIWKLEE